MEIQGNSATPTAAAGHGETPAAEAGGARTGQAADHGAGHAGETRVALSERARGMLAIRRAVDGAPQVRDDRVAQCKARVDAGTYNIEGRLVARAVVREAMLEAVA